MLIISAGQLYCDACHMVISIKKSIVQGHISPDRHARGKEAKLGKLNHQQVLASWEAYQKRYAATIPGTGLSPTVDSNEVMARIETGRAFLKAGIPLAKVDFPRPLLEHRSSRLTDRSHLATYISFMKQGSKKSKRRYKTSPT